MRATDLPNLKPYGAGCRTRLRCQAFSFPIMAQIKKQYFSTPALKFFPVAFLSINYKDCFSFQIYPHKIHPQQLICQSTPPMKKAANIKAGFLSSGPVSDDQSANAPELKAESSPLELESNKTANALALKAEPSPLELVSNDRTANALDLKAESGPLELVSNDRAAIAPERSNLIDNSGLEVCIFRKR